MRFSKKVISEETLYYLLYGVLVDENGNANKSVVAGFFNAYALVKRNISAIVTANRVAEDDMLVNISHQLYYLHSALDKAFESSENHNYQLLSKRLVAIKEQFSKRHPIFFFKFVAQKKSVEVYQDALSEMQAIERQLRAILDCDPSN
jgi:hypothetical protein